MNEIIPIVNDRSNRPTVMGRELHKALGLKTPYHKWFARMCEYDFAEGVDFIAIGQKCPTAQGNMTTFTDHQLTLSMAKEICMIQRSEIGKKCRKYFIEVERRYKTNAPQLPTQVTETIKTLEKRVEYLEHHAENLLPLENLGGASITKSLLASIEWEIFLKSVEICGNYGCSVSSSMGNFVERYIRKSLCCKLRTTYLRDLPMKLYSTAIRFVVNFQPDEYLTQFILKSIL